MAASLLKPVQDPTHPNGDISDDMVDEPEPMRFYTFEEFRTALQQASATFIQDKHQLYTWLNSAENTLFATSGNDVTTNGVQCKVTLSELDSYLDLHAANITPSNILTLAQTLNGEGKRVADLNGLTCAIHDLQHSHSQSKSLLFTYLSSNAQRLLAKSVILHDADLSSLITVASSGAAALLILQYLEKELLLTHYVLQARSVNNQLTQGERDAAVEEDALLGGMSMSQLIRTVAAYSEDSAARWKDVKHFVVASKLVAEDVGSCDVTELLASVNGTDILADVAVHLVWLFAHGMRFATWEDLKLALQHGAENGPSNILTKVDTKREYYLPKDEHMMIVLHLFGPICSLLQPGALFAEKSQFSSLLASSGADQNANLIFQHLIGLQYEAGVTCATMKQLIETIEKRHEDILAKKKETLNFLTSKECKLFANPTTTMNGGKDSYRFPLTAANIDRLFALAQSEGDIYKLLTEACAPVKADKDQEPAAPSPRSSSSSSLLHPIMKHAPYRFFSHLIMAVRGFYPHQYVLHYKRPNIIGGNVSDEWHQFPSIERLSVGLSPLVYDPMTHSSLALDSHELHQLLASSHGNPHALAMHLTLLTMMARTFTSFHALHQAVQVTQRESKARIPELREILASIHGLFNDPQFDGYKFTKPELESLYYQSGAGPLCIHFINEMLETESRSIGSVKELVERVKEHHARFMQRRECEIEMLKAVFRGSWDVKQLFGKGSNANDLNHSTTGTQIHAHSRTISSLVHLTGSTGASSGPGVAITSTDLAQLLLSCDSGAGLLIHLQHAAMAGNEFIASVDELQKEVARGTSQRVKESILAILQSTTHPFFVDGVDTHSWDLTHVDDLLDESRTQSDGLVHLWALRSTGENFKSFDSLGALSEAVSAGRRACLQPKKAQLAIIFAYLHAPTINLLVPSEKIQLTVDDVDKLVTLCGGSYLHTFTMLISLDHSNVQYQSIKDLAEDMLHLYETRTTQQVSRPQTAQSRSRSRRPSKLGRPDQWRRPSTRMHSQAVANVDQLVPSASNKDWNQSPIFTLLRDSSSHILLDPRSLTSSHLDDLLRTCDGDEELCFALMRHLRHGRPAYDGMALLLDCVQSIVTTLPSLADQVTNYLNRSTTTLTRRWMDNHSPTVPIITTTAARSLILTSEAGAETLPILRHLDRTNKQFHRVATAEFDSLDELILGVRFEYLCQLGRSSDEARQLSKITGSTTNGVSKTIEPPLSLLQSPIARAQKLTTEQLSEQIVKFLQSSACHLFVAPIDGVDANACQQLYYQSSGGRDTLGHLWCLDAAGRKFATFAELATALRARVQLYQMLLNSSACQKIDALASSTQIDEFLDSIHSKVMASSNGDWFQRRLTSEALKPDEPFKDFDAFIEAFHSRDHLARPTSLDRKVSPSYTPERSALSELAAHRRVRSLALEAAASPKTTPSSTPRRTPASISPHTSPNWLDGAAAAATAEMKVSTSASAGEYVSYDTKRQSLLLFLRDPRQSLFIDSTIVSSLTYTDVDRLLKMAGGPDKDALQVMKYLTKLKQSGQQFSSPSDLCFAVLKVHRTTVDQAQRNRSANAKGLKPSASVLHLDADEKII